jgi:hypothetical protein
MVTMGIFPFKKKNPMVESGIEPGIMGQKLWPLDHKAGLFIQYYLSDQIKEKEIRGTYDEYAR